MHRGHSRAAAAGLSLLVALSCAGEEKDPVRPSVVVTSGGTGATSGSGGISGGVPGGEGGREDYPGLPGEPCNAWAALCDVPYDQVSFPVTHAAMANTASFWDYPAQRRPLRSQLDDSIRGLMLEVHIDEGELALCFYDCAQGRSNLLPELRQVREFLDDNPREVVTLLVDNRAPAAEFAAAAASAGLDAYLFSGDVLAGWPTLGELVAQGTRLVVFVEDATSAPPGYRDSRASIARTSGQVGRARDLDCDLTAGDEAASMLLVQQVLVTEDGVPGAGGEGGAATLGRPSEALAETVNRDPFLSERLSLCAESFGRNPTFVAVDFYDTSDVIGATQRLGGLID
jgi:hypothetical protein